MLGVIPAQQGFDRRNGSGTDLNLRLVVKDKLSACKCAVQIAYQPETALVQHIEFRSKEAVGTTSIRFSCIHCRVGSAKQNSWIISVVRILANTDAAAYLDFMAFYPEWIEQSGKQLLRHYLDVLFAADRGKRNHEFIAA